MEDRAMAEMMRESVAAKGVLLPGAYQITYRSRGETEPGAFANNE
jgi:hypothetical protein